MGHIWDHLELSQTSLKGDWDVGVILLVGAPPQEAPWVADLVGGFRSRRRNRGRSEIKKGSKSMDRGELSSIRRGGRGESRSRCETCGQRRGRSSSGSRYRGSRDSWETDTVKLAFKVQDLLGPPPLPWPPWPPRLPWWFPWPHEKLTIGFQKARSHLLQRDSYINGEIVLVDRDQLLHRVKMQD